MGGSDLLQPGERALLTLRPSQRLLVAEAVQAAVLVAFTLALPIGLGFLIKALTGYEETDFLALLLGSGSVGAELVYLVPRIGVAWVHVTFTDYALTDERVYARTRFLSTDLKVVPYEKVTLVRIRRSLVERIFGISELGLRAYGANEGLVRMRGLVDPRPFYALLLDRLRVHNTAESLVRSD